MKPRYIKEAMKMMNETIRDSLIAGLSRGGMKARKSNNPIANLLGEMFLPKDGYKDKIDTRNYEKGQVAWDGIARKSLVEVIPTYLAKIYAALGGEEKYFDYESGKFVKIEQIKALEVLDSRGNPTVQVEVITEGGFSLISLPISGRMHRLKDKLN